MSTPDPSRRPLSPAELATVRRQSRQQASFQVPVGQTIGVAANGQPLDFRPQGFWAVLTDEREDNRYGWVKAFPREDGSVDIDTPGVGTLSGTPDTWPAVEVNGAEDLVEDEGPFWLVPGQGAYFVFDSIRIANWTEKDGDGEEIAWRGGRFSTAEQSLKGVKTFRDQVRVQRAPFVTLPAPIVYISSEATGSGLAAHFWDEDATGRVVAVAVSAGVSGSNASGGDYLSGSWYIGGQVGSGPTMKLGSDGGVWLGPGGLIPSGGGGSCGALSSYLVLSESAHGLVPGNPAGASLCYGVDRASGRKWGVDGTIEVVTAVDFGTSKATTTKYEFAGGLYLGPVVPPPPPPPVPPPPPPPPPPPAGQGAMLFSAWIDDDEDGVWDAGEAAAAGRLVVYSGPTPGSGYTDENGYLHVVGLTPGGYSASVSLATGEVCAENSDPVSIVADTTTDVERPIIPPEPPQIGNVIVIIQENNSGTYTLISRSIVFVGDNGGLSGTRTGDNSYKIFGLPVGDYTFSVTPDAGDDGTWAWTISTPDSGSGVDADQFALGAGDTTTVTFTLSPPPPPAIYYIRGNVNRDSSPAAGDNIEITAGGSGSDEVDMSGDYEIGPLADGVYTVAPVLTGTDFSTPADIDVTISGGDSDGNDFEITTGA